MKTGEGSKGKRLCGPTSHIKELGPSPKNIGDHLRVLRSLEEAAIKMGSCSSQK